MEKLVAMEGYEDFADTSVLVLTFSCFAEKVLYTSIP